MCILNNLICYKNKNKFVTTPCAANSFVLYDKKQKKTYSLCFNKIRQLQLRVYIKQTHFLAKHEYKKGKWNLVVDGVYICSYLDKTQSLCIFLCVHIYITAFIVMKSGKISENSQAPYTPNASSDHRYIILYINLCPKLSQTNLFCG